MRVRGFTQDDAHIFCTEAQVEPEVIRFIDLLQRVYADFGFDEILVKLSTRPAKRVGTDEQWDKAEAALKTALDAQGRSRYELQPGEGAFYGPKIEFSLKDSLGRVWQCGTMQLDFSMPGGSAPSTWPRTTRATCRSCCTGRSSARSSASSAS